MNEENKIRSAVHVMSQARANKGRLDCEELYIFIINFGIFSVFVWVRPKIKREQKTYPQPINHDLTHVVGRRQQVNFAVKEKKHRTTY